MKKKIITALVLAFIAAIFYAAIWASDNTLPMKLTDTGIVLIVQLMVTGFGLYVVDDCDDGDYME